MTKIKLFVFIVIFTISVLGLYAEAPELRNVMPNSWRKVTKLTAAEEQAFALENSALFEEIKDFILYIVPDRGDSRKYEHYSIYKQQVGTDTFYRILWTESVRSDFLSPNIYFIQFLIYQGIKICATPYLAVYATQDGQIGAFNSIDIIPGKEKAKGILMTYVATSIERSSNNAKVWNMVSRQKGQLVGWVHGSYYFMEEALKMAADKKHLEIEIEASDCLVDPNIPLRYSLQNAFDGDPSTSYVENTRDDLIEIKLAVKDITRKKIAVINGYAQDMSLYKDNNRIKTIRLYYSRSSKFYDIELADNTLGWQFIETNDCDINTIEIYRGEKYNDTCIAEFNVYTEQYGWLFGDIDE
jgi:hypothetical protein